MHNFITFIFIMRSILKTRMKSNQTQRNKSKRNDIVARLQNAVTISILLGLTWVFGFLAIEGATFTFQLIFCLCNSFQGLVIFLLFCFRAEDVRKTLKPYFHWAKLPDIRRGSSYDVSGVESKTMSSSADPVSLSTFNVSFQLPEGDDGSGLQTNGQEVFSSLATTENIEDRNGNKSANA